MKRLLIIAMMIIAAVSMAYAAPGTWHPANQVTVAWDAVLAETGAIKYAVYRQQIAMGTAAAIGDPVQVGITEATEQAVSFEEQGAYIIGVQSQLYADDGEMLAESEIVWSDNPEVVADGVTFGVRYFLVGGPGKIRIVQ